MAFVKRLKQRLEWYGHTHNEVPSLQSIARLVQPFLDNMVYKKNQVPDPSLPPPVPGERPEFELTEVQQLLTDAFTGAAERHIEVGDGLDMLVIEKGEDGKGGAKMSWVNLPLKRD